MIFFLSHFPAPLMTIFYLSELLVGRYKRKDDYARDLDLGSFQLIVLVMFVCMILYFLVIFCLPQAKMDALLALSGPAIGIFALGFILRWYSIFRLGRFFTIQVAISADHQLIESGLYRFIRHPSYTGLLLMFLAFGIRSGNIVALLVIFLPLVAVLMHRMRIEETALIETFGNSYVEYMGRTKRIIPLLY